MYNKYSYDLTKNYNMNFEPNIKDCFEQLLCNNDDINDILNNIKCKLIKDNYESINNESEETKKLNNYNFQLYKNNNNGTNNKYDNPNKKYENTKNRNINFTRTSQEYIKNRCISNEIFKSTKFRNKYTETN